jgi:hypothetical protein
MASGMLSTEWKKVLSKRVQFHDMHDFHDSYTASIWDGKEKAWREWVDQAAAVESRDETLGALLSAARIELRLGIAHDDLQTAKVAEAMGLAAAFKLRFSRLPTPRIPFWNVRDFVEFPDNEDLVKWRKAYIKWHAHADLAESADTRDDLHAELDACADIERAFVGEHTYMAYERTAALADFLAANTWLPKAAR